MKPNITAGFFTFFILFLLAGRVFSQDEENLKKIDCIDVREITIPLDESQFSLKNGKDDFSYNLIYYQDADEYTFWYKINVTEDCILKFSVNGTVPSDDYDFMLYQFSTGNFCEAIVDNLVMPINDNYYDIGGGGPAAGTGAKGKIAFQRELKVRKGQTYYISVLNISGDDCGHQLFLDACDNSMVVNSVHKPCFVYSQPKPSELDQPAVSVSQDILIIDEDVTITGIVRDNDNGRSISATLSYMDAVSGEEFSARSTSKDGYRITLERGRRYNLNCEAFGYYAINGTMEFWQSSVYDYYLLKIKKGDNFIVDNIYFHPNTYAFKDEATESLENLYNYLADNEKIVIEIEGHTAGNTDVTSQPPSNKSLGPEWNFTGSATKLSKLRAEAVQDYLIGRGIKAKRISTVGYGADRMLISRPRSEEERRKNMRVEIKIISTGSEIPIFQSPVRSTLQEQ